MAKGASPSQDQLLELLKRAADELKHAQEEARTAVMALQKEQAAHGKTEAELEAAQAATKGAHRQAGTDEQLLKDQISAERESGKALAARVKELEAALEGAASERAELQAKAGEADTAVSVAQQQHDAAVQRLQGEHQAALEAATAELQAKLEALQAGQQKAVDEALAAQAARAAELEGQLREAESHHRGVLDDAAGKLVQAEAALTQEREKHQTTAQKLLETRSKVRELESTLGAEHERVKGLEVAARQLADAHELQSREAGAKQEAELAALTGQHQQQTAELQQSYLRVQAELQTVTGRWQDVERQYEALHREMLLTLEQRDEARRLLESERQERERLQRALQSHR